MGKFIKEFYYVEESGEIMRKGKDSGHAEETDHKHSHLHFTTLEMLSDIWWIKPIAYCFKSSKWMKNSHNYI